MNSEQIVRLIEKNDSIVIFRHVKPDYDAIGSQLGMAEIIRKNWPSKKVFCAGTEDLPADGLVSPMDKLDDKQISCSLAVILDVSNRARVDDQRYAMAADSLRIDHHPFTEKVAAHEAIDTSSTSTCQLIAEWACRQDLKMDRHAAELLYAGINNDTVKLAIAKVDARAFECCAYLAGFGIDIVKVNRAMYDLSPEAFSFVHWLGGQVMFKGALAYAQVSLDDLARFHIDANQAKEQVTVMNYIRGIQVWALFQQIGSDDFSASLRSSSKPIVDIARAFEGGGHPLACGIPHLTSLQVRQVVERLAAIAGDDR